MVCSNVDAQSVSAIQFVNSSGTDAADALNNQHTFTTSFEGVNDVTITSNDVTLPSLTSDNYGSTGPNGAGDNPGYITRFVGNTAEGTGDSTAGVIEELQTYEDSVLTFNFSIPLNTADRLLIADCDIGESYTIQAFSGSTPLSLTGWVNQTVSGQTGEDSDSEWASWNPTGGGADTGTLTANTSNNLNEPLDVLTPAAGQSVTELIFTQTAAGETTDNAGFQILEVPEPTSLALIGLAVLLPFLIRYLYPQRFRAC